MSTILKSAIKAEKPDREQDNSCPVCGEGRYIQYKFSHEHTAWIKGGWWIAQPKYTVMQVDMWMTYNGPWTDISKKHFTYLGDYVFVDTLDDQWQHKLHHLMKYNSHVHALHMDINANLFKFNNNHEKVKEGPYKNLRINWMEGVTNDRGVSELLNRFFTAYGAPPNKCATFSLGTGKWFKGDWGWFVPEFRRFFYHCMEIDEDQIETVSNTTLCIDVLTRHYKDDPDHISKKARDTFWIDYETKYAMQKLFKKPARSIHRKFTEEHKKMYRAKKKSERLLLSHLTHGERITLKNTGVIKIPSKINPRNWYEVQNWHKGTIEVHNKKEIVERLCYQLNDNLPIGDEILAKYIACKFDEKEMLKVAVVCAV